jgi:hypothetical protein
LPKSVRSDIDSLAQEARALELLADEAEVPPERLQQYWDVSADLIGLVTDIEELRAQTPSAGYEDPEMLALRRRVREIASSLAELSFLE